MERTGLAYLLGAAFFFSLMTVCVKLAGARLPAEQIILARAVIGLGLSAIAVKRAGLPWSGNARRFLVLRGVLGSCGLYCFFSAVTMLPLAEVTVIHYTNPILTAILAAVLLAEGLAWSLGLALVVSLVGVALVARPQFLFGGGAGLDPVAVTIALCGAVFSAGAYVTVRKLRTTDHPAVVVLYFPLIATPVFLPLALRAWVSPTPIEWLVLAGVGVTTQIAQVCLTRGLHLVPAGRGTAVGYIQIAFAIVWSLVIFGERLEWPAAVGAGLVVFGVILAARKPRPAK